ncbi:phosphatase 2A-associated protein [Polychaeton citri CBS 116435]|uniref:Phosphatase 2A-associated protein n=1 Tax=Polychaeton citri CBS 116435 TaxID=1314669 RepID=A0A9P4Q6P2_9PEZI|nr:phosphatase 2A-associated protein [Polychaeton citri CBS 116435]
MSDGDRSLRSVYSDAEQQRHSIENTFNSNSAAFQELVETTLKLYEQCVDIAGRISLFSPNESLEDIATVDLQYLLLNYRTAELCMRMNGQNRKDVLHKAQKSYQRYLRQLDDYSILSKDDERLLEHYEDSPSTFSVAATKDAAAKRDTKIRRFKEEKALRQKLDYLRQNPSVVQNDDAVHRELQMVNVAYCTHETFANLESIAQELHIISLAPPAPPAGQPQVPADARERTRGSADGYSDRLDNHLSAGLRGPLLDPQGKPLQPFTLTSKRQDFREGVFRSGHRLPTMSIDEYLEEERKRGGIIEGGGPQSGIQPEPNEDDLEAADRETMKAREWDEYVEANPKGSGNTINRG